MHPIHRLMVPILLLTALMGTVACVALQPADAREITGKVVAVFVEPVTVNTKVLDKMSVTVASCPSGKYETVVYSPGSVSDDNSLGFLFEHQVNHARAAITKNQYMNMVNGHATFVVPDNGTTVQKTTFWGYNWECGINVSGTTGAGAPSTGQTQPSPSQGRPAPSGNPFMKRLPGF